MTYQTVKYEVSAGVATITLNRPDSLNALNDPMRVEFVDALKAAETDDEVRCVILTGAGRAFSAGADVKSWNRSLGENAQAAERPNHLVVPIFESDFRLVVLKMTKPVIAAINGPAVGWGATMPLTCDIRLASEAARISFNFTKRAVAPEYGCSFFLPRLVGYGMAKELLLTGRFVDAREAKEIGLVNAVYTAEELMPRTAEMARSIAANAPISVKFTKRGINLSLDSTHRDMLEFEHWAIHTCRQSEDFKESTRAFVEKRTPLFKGR